MVTAYDVIRMLADTGYDFYTGVPDSILAGIIAVLTEQGRYTVSVREDEAVGIAAGAYLAGKHPVVLMQNSGLGTCLNALTSLNLIYSIPCLLLVSWRGYQGKDAPEHRVMGDVCRTILETISVPVKIVAAESIGQDIRWSRDIVRSTHAPVALFIKSGIVH